MRRLLSLLLTLVLTASLLTVPAVACGRHPFADVPDDHWSAEGVQYVYENGLMNGTSATTFEPDSPFSRAMFVTILGRMEGVDKADYPGTAFSDIGSVSWARPYIQWASEMGIVNGVGNGKFDPDSTITREQYCTILVRYMDSTGRDFLGQPALIPTYPDVDRISTYAVTGFLEMASYGLMDEVGGNALPRVDMTRADIAVLFSRFHDMLAHGNTPCVYNIRQDPCIGWDEVAEILADTSSFTWDWMYNNSYTDPGDTIYTYNPLTEDWETMERVLYPWVFSGEELTALARQHYTKGAWEELTYHRFWVQTEGGLYFPKITSSGGYFDDMEGCDLIVEQLSETSFALEIMPYDGRSSLGTFYNTLTYQDGFWVFTYAVPPLLDRVPVAFG